MNCCISFNFECVPGQSVLLLNGGLVSARMWEVIPPRPCA